jgi:hypothetical protein
MIMLHNQPAVLSPAPSAKSGPSPDPIGVCLDYAMGTCTRAHCKYPHPDLTPLIRMREQYGHQGVVCEVYALTGHCRFGAKCTKTHPAFGALPVPSPQVPLLPKHVSFRPIIFAQPTVDAPRKGSPLIPMGLRATPILFTPTDGRGTPETEAATTPTDRKATELDAFAADMRRSREQPEEYPPAKQLTAEAPGPGQPLLSCGMGSIFMDILRDLHEIPY